MKFHIYIIHLYLFYKVFSSSFKYNFGKYQSYSTRDNHAIFDPTEFDIGDTMYFKVTSSGFNDERLGYEYLDEIPDGYSFTFDNIKRTEKSYHKKDDDDDNEAIRYYKIKKSKEELGSLKGTYLIFYFDCEGKVEIENTEKDEGKISFIVSIVISVVGVIVIGIIIYFCYCRKKKEDSEDDKNSNGSNKNSNNNQEINHREGNSPPQNYVSQNGIYSNQNINNNYVNNNNYANYNNSNFYNSSNNIYLKNNNNNMNNTVDTYNNSKGGMIYNNQLNNINSQYYPSTERVNIEITKPQNNNQNVIQYNIIPKYSNNNFQMP